MSDIEQAICDLIEKEVSSVVETEVENSLSSHDLLDLHHRVEDLEQKLEDNNDDDTIDLVVGHIIKKLIGDSNQVVSKAYVGSLHDQITELKSKLAETKSDWVVGIRGQKCPLFLILINGEINETWIRQKWMDFFWR